VKGVTWLISGLVLSLLLVSAVSVGSQISLPLDFFQVSNLKIISQNSNSVVSQLDQLASVTSTWDIIADWLYPLTSWLSDLWFNFLEAWKRFLGLIAKDEPEITPAMREKIREELLAELKNQGLVNAELLAGENGGAKYGIMVAPSTGSTTRDEWLKKSLSQMFADEVSLKFDKTGMSGVVTPTFRDGRKGGDYVFVLTPLL
jgi:hypothetical protein